MASSPEASAEPLLRSIPETLVKLGIGRTLLYDKVEDDELVMVKIGRRSFITDQSITDYVDRLAKAGNNRPRAHHGGQ